MKENLNVDIPSAAAEFESLINKVYPKRFFYKLLLRGKGLEFDGYRQFSSDEDSQLIDWKASVRANSLVAKQYIEERDIKTFFLVDVSDNMIFGSQKKLKCEYAAELSAAFARTLLNGGDRVGFILFNHQFIKITLPERGSNTFDIFSNELSNAENYGGYCDIKAILEELLDVLNPSISFLVLVSDFVQVNATCKELLERIGSVVETIAIIVKDPLDELLPDLNKELIIENPNTGEKLIVNPSLAKKSYEFYTQQQESALKDIFEDSNIDCLKLMTSEDFSPPLVLFLKNRAERR
ncbi:MAG: DUF58 domain-containing protein [Candidatus Pacearchaeota archaeon]|jgi:uncharacterized protein (DUF58 family)